MQFNTIHFILNPASGQEKPILSYINEVFKSTDIKWEILVTKEGGDARKFAKELIGKTDLIAIYGGDGSVSEVAEALIGCNTPFIIIPGGTANVMAKELGIPTEPMEALKLLRDGLFTIKKIDMGRANQIPFMLRVNYGILADMVTQANRELKNSLGQLAYGVSSFQSISNAKSIDFKLTIDGEEYYESGVALTITNSGSIGIKDYLLLPGISINDGYLDIILLKEADFLSLMKIAGSTLLQTESNILKHWKCKEVTISTSENLNIILDDCERTENLVHIKVLHEALLVLSPNEINEE